MMSLRRFPLVLPLVLSSCCTLGSMACATTVSSGDGPSSSSLSSSDPLVATARAQLDSLRTLAVAYETSNGRCPTTVEDVASPTPVDPWGSPIAFMPTSPENPRSAFVSSGPDRSLLTDDDLSAPVACSSR